MHQASAISRWHANLMLLSVALIWGAAFVAQSQAMSHVEPMQFTGMRFLIGALVVLPLALWEWRGKQARGEHHSLLDGGHVLGLGLLLALGAVLQQMGIGGTTVTNAGFLTALYVPLVPMLAWALMGKRPHWLIIPMALGCVLGTWMLSGAGDVAVHPGDYWVLASVVPWALHVLWVGDVARRMSAPFCVAAGQFLACGLFSMVWSLASETGSWSWADLAPAAGALAFTGVLSVGIGFTLQVVAQRHTHATDAALLLSSETLFAALCGYWFMADQLSPIGWAGGALIFACMVAVQLLPARSGNPTTSG